MFYSHLKLFYDVLFPQQLEPELAVDWETV